MTTEQAQEKVAVFQKEFSELMTRSFNSGVPLPNMIMSLADAEFELRQAMSELQREMRIKEQTHKIVTLGANGIHLPPGRQ